MTKAHKQTQSLLNAAMVANAIASDSAARIGMDSNLLPPITMRFLPDNGC